MTKEGIDAFLTAAFTQGCRQEARFSPRFCSRAPLSLSSGCGKLSAKSNPVQVFSPPGGGSHLSASRQPFQPFQTAPTAVECLEYDYSKMRLTGIRAQALSSKPSLLCQSTFGMHALTLSQRVLSQDDSQPVNRQLEGQTQLRTVQHSCMRFSSCYCCRYSLKAQSYWQTRMVNVLMAAVCKHCHAAFFKGGSM